MRIWAFFLFLFASVGYAQNVKTYIPPHAFEYRPTIAAELDRYFPTLYDYNYVPALIEHESCIALTHSRCWKSTSQLKTAREQGVVSRHPRCSPPPQRRDRRVGTGVPR